MNNLNFFELKALFLICLILSDKDSILDKNSLCSAINGVDIVIHLAAMLGVKKTEDNKSIMFCA